MAGTPAQDPRARARAAVAAAREKWAQHDKAEQRPVARVAWCRWFTEAGLRCGRPLPVVTDADDQWCGQCERREEPPQRDDPWMARADAVQQATDALAADLAYPGRALVGADPHEFACRYRRWDAVRAELAMDPWVGCPRPAVQLLAWTDPAGVEHHSYACVDHVGAVADVAARGGATAVTATGPGSTAAERQRADAVLVALAHHWPTTAFQVVGGPLHVRVEWVAGPSDAAVQAVLVDEQHRGLLPVGGLQLRWAQA